MTKTNTKGRGKAPEIEARCPSWPRFERVDAVAMSEKELRFTVAEDPPWRGEMVEFHVGTGDGKAELEGVVISVGSSGGRSFVEVHVTEPADANVIDVLPLEDDGGESEDSMAVPVRIKAPPPAKPSRKKPAPMPHIGKGAAKVDGASGYSFTPGRDGKAKAGSDRAGAASGKRGTAGAHGGTAGSYTAKSRGAGGARPAARRRPLRRRRKSVGEANGRYSAKSQKEESQKPVEEVEDLRATPVQAIEDVDWSLFEGGGGSAAEGKEATPSARADARPASADAPPLRSRAAAKSAAAAAKPTAAATKPAAAAAPPESSGDDLRATPVVPDPAATGALAGSQPVEQAGTADDLTATPLPPEGFSPAEEDAAARDRASVDPVGHDQPVYQAQEPAEAATTPNVAETADLRQIGTRSGSAGRKAPATIGRAEAPVVGLDFGTTYSKIAFAEAGEVILIEDEAAKASTRASVPSVVAFERDGSYTVGEEAREVIAVSPNRVVSSAKRVLGMKYSDPLAGGLLGSLACPSQSGPNDSILFTPPGNTVTVPQVSAKVLEHLVSMASRTLGAKVKKAVLTMPVDFDLAARREFELAAKMAGIEIVALVLEPVAAAMGCGYTGQRNAVLAVYDFGGGTFDASIVEVGAGQFVVKGAAGDRWLGGDDLDEVLARFVADEFQTESGISLHNRVEEWRRLLLDCEEAKRWLSSLNSVDVILPRAALTPKGPVTLLVPVTRDEFEECAADVIESSIGVCEQAVYDAGINPNEVNALLATGGTSRIPMVLDSAEDFFGRKAAVGIHPENAVVIGAAVHAAVASGQPVAKDFVDRLRGQGSVGLTVGLALAGGETEHIIDAKQQPPVAAHRQYATAKDGQTTIRLELVEGMSKVTGQNRRVGGFVIDGLPSAQAGTITIDVYFELSSTATLNVTAVERSKGRRAQAKFDLVAE